MWDSAYLLEAVRASLADEEQSLARQQAVRGIDGVDEVVLHPVIAKGLQASGFGVLREQGYPGQPQDRPADRDRERCDLVLLPSQGKTLADPLIRVREQDRAAGTLFETVEHDRPDEPDAIAVGDAYWLEVKVVGQFQIVDGYAHSNAAYASELVRSIAQDVRKLSRDESIELGGLLLVLFTRDEQIARHDLTMALHRCLDQDVPLGQPDVEVFPITDRIGNTMCLLALVPARSYEP